MAKKILIAGKERNLSHFVSMELQKQDYVVDYASNGAEALLLAQETDFDLLIVSYQLADMTSTELAEKILRYKPATVMIVVVESDEAQKYGEEIEKYAVFYIIKPFVISDLVEQVTTIFPGAGFHS